jgi:hypothetical protein
MSPVAASQIRAVPSRWPVASQEPSGATATVTGPQAWPAPLERYGAFFGFHWPGDHRFKPTSVATFPVRIAEAQVAGQQLARLIRKCLRSDQEVFFIAHSLGCRVVMEALYAMAAMEADGVVGLAPVRGVFLMAGAVPHQKCDGDDIFHRRDPERPRDWVIHSARDLVLSVPFPSGEWLHGEGGGEAIGRHGLPAGRWHRNARHSHAGGRRVATVQFAFRDRHTEIIERYHCRARSPTRRGPLNHARVGLLILTVSNGSFE